MTSTAKPYFLSNEEWYTVDITFSAVDGRGYHLTDKAPAEAIKSYEEFYAEVETDAYTLVEES